MFSRIVRHIGSVIVALVVGIFTCSLQSDNVIVKADTCIIESKESNYPRCSVTTPAELECNQDKKEITITAESTKDALRVECSAPYILDADFDGEQPFENIQITPEWKNETDGVTFVLRFLPWQSSAAAALVGKYTFFALHNKTIEQSFYIYYKDTDDYRHLLMFPDKRKIKGYYKDFNNSREYILPCRPLSKTTNVTLMFMRNGRPFSTEDLPCVSFNNQLGFIANVDAGLCSEAFKTNGSNFKCEAKNKGLSKIVDVEVDLRVPQANDAHELTISYDPNRKEAFCSIVEKKEEPGQLIRLRNIKSRNPLESKFKRHCSDSNTNQRGCSQRILKSGRMKLCFHNVTNGSSSSECEYIEDIFPFGLLLCHYKEQRLIKEYFFGVDGVFYDYNDRDIPTEAKLKIFFNTSSSDKAIYQNISYLFTCKVVAYGTSAPILWYIQENNKEFVFHKTALVNVEASEEYLEIKEHFYISKNLTGIMCSARLWDSKDWFNTSVNISSKVPMMPSFQKSTEKLTFYIGENNKFLTCHPNGAPAPEIKWFKNGKSIANEMGTGLSELKFSLVEKPIEGIYICKATNNFGESNKTFILSVQNAKGTSNATIVGIAVVVVVLFIGVVVFLSIFCHKRSKKYLLSSREMNTFLRGNSTGTSDCKNHYVSIPYRSEDYEISKYDLIIEENSVLGSGAFGIVCKGKFENMDVAVKTTKENCDKTYIMSILDELKIMMHIGKHENIVYLVGAVTKEARKGKVFLVLELYTGGSLEGRLRSCQYFINSKEDMKVNISGYENLSKTDLITITEALRWSFEIANGMDYLSKKNVIHGDLATRNILLDGRLCAKISDFGLSRKLYQYGSYEKSSKDPLPWRWMAIESLRSNTFSLKSDIWSYGVLLWEIFSKGDMPYPGLNWTVDFVSNLLENLRLGKPKHADEEMYTLMCGCWHEDPDQRIPFCDLMERISERITTTPSISFESATHLADTSQYEDIVPL